MYSEIEPSDAAGNHDLQSDHGHEHFGHGSFEASYTEEPSEAIEEISVQEEVVRSSVEVEEPEELVRSHSPESGDTPLNPHADDGTTSEPPPEGGLDNLEELKQELVNDDIADIVGLLESTSFTSKRILQESDEGVASDSYTSHSEKERQRIGEIPDED